MNLEQQKFFDGIAERWDGWEDLGRLAVRLDQGLRAFQVDPDEAILDVGCGTGNLTKALLSQLGPGGRVEAVDLSRNMLSIAAQKVQDPRVRWTQADITELQGRQGLFHRVMCYSVWPHFQEEAQAASILRSMLRPGGTLHVWHLSGRERINDIHAHASPAVAKDLLRPVSEVAALLRSEGFDIVDAREDSDSYLITALRREEPSR